MCLKKVKLKTAAIDEVFVTEIKLDVIKLKKKTLYRPELDCTGCYHKRKIPEERRKAENKL